MGSSGGYRSTPAPLALYEQPPKTRRAQLAEPVVGALLTRLCNEVLRPSHALGTQRECYEVSWALRRQQGGFETEVRRLVPGSYLGTMSLDRKIAMVFVSHVDAVLIRPGPTPEDRDSGDMVNEAWALRRELEALVAAVITVDDDEKGL